jgi:monoamine oxidase
LHEDISFSEWVFQKGLKSPFIDALSMHLTSAVVGREPSEVGVHYLLDYIKSAGGYLSIISEGEHGAQSLKIKQGKPSSFLKTLPN